MKKSFYVLGYLVTLDDPENRFNPNDCLDITIGKDGQVALIKNITTKDALVLNHGFKSYFITPGVTLEFAPNQRYPAPERYDDDDLDWDDYDRDYDCHD